MLKSAQKATRGEGGFTLIELLVVMIIIAILMAVAVPTFLKQKQNALATKAKANIKQVVTTIESCAATNTTGSYIAPRNCTTPAILLADEPSMTQVGLSAGTAPPADVCQVGNGVATGYTVTCGFTSDTGVGRFTETHQAGGQILKDCSGAPKACPAGLPVGKMW